MYVVKNLLRKGWYFSIIILLFSAYIAPVVLSEDSLETKTIQKIRPVWYVDIVGGSNSNGGSGWADAWKDIQYAIDNPLITNGDTILVGAGTYNENLDVYKQLTILGAQNGGGPSIINGVTMDHVVYVTSDQVTISIFTIQNSGTDDWWDSGIALDDADDCIITENVIKSNNAGILVKSSRNEIMNNTIEDNDNGIFLYPGSDNIISYNIFKNHPSGRGIYSNAASQYNLFSNNVFLNNWEAITIFGGLNTIEYNEISSSNNYGISLISAYDTEIYWNEITRNGIGIFMAQNSSITKIENNTLQCNIYGIYIRDSFETIIKTNFIKHNDHGVYIVGASSNNLIYNNYFANTQNAHDQYGVNTWYINPISGTNIMGGSQIGGNYWDDFPNWHKYGLFYRPNGNGLVSTSGDGYPIHPNTNPAVSPTDIHPIPGFELVALIAGIAIALFLYKRK